MHHRAGSSSLRIAMPSSPASPGGERQSRTHGRSSSVNSGTSTSGVSAATRASGRAVWAFNTSHPYSPMDGAVQSYDTRRPLRQTNYSAPGSSDTNGTRRVPSKRMLTILTLALVSFYTITLRSQPIRWQLPTILTARHILAPTPSSSASLSHSASQDSVKPVDRNILQKLRVYELRKGWASEDEDEVEQYQADRVRARPINIQANAKPALPAILNIPGARKEKVQLSPENHEAIRQLSLIPPQELDAAFCPLQSHGCKFLYAAWVGEQETKAQMHLYQLGLLAVALNRTLVLPNVARSRMMSCAAQPFDFYYAPDSLIKLGIPTVTSSQLAEWSSKRAVQPSAQIISIAGDKPEFPQGALEVDGAAVDPSRIPFNPKRNFCLEPPRTYLNFSRFSPLTAYPPPGWHKTEQGQLRFGESLINTLKSYAVSAQSYRMFEGETQRHSPLSLSPDVLVLNYELRYPILTATHLQNLALYTPGNAVSHPNVLSIRPFQHFEYSSIWTNMAAELVSALSPFIAVHWRQETLPVESMQPCAESLIETLVQLTTVQYPSIKTVYLATDYPLEDLESGKEGVVVHSGTFAKVLTEKHHTAMENFLRKFNKRLTDLHDVRLTTLTKEEDRLTLPKRLEELLIRESGQSSGSPKLDIAELDAGLLGIMDKTIAMHAEVLLVGNPLNKAKTNTDEACAKESSFTNQIVDARRAHREDMGGAAGLWNDVEYWSRSHDESLVV